MSRNISSGMYVYVLYLRYILKVGQEFSFALQRIFVLLGDYGHQQISSNKQELPIYQPLYTVNCRRQYHPNELCDPIFKLQCVTADIITQLYRLVLENRRRSTLVNTCGSPL